MGESPIVHSLLSLFYFAIYAASNIPLYPRKGLQILCSMLYYYLNLVNCLCTHIIRFIMMVPYFRLSCSNNYNSIEAQTKLVRRARGAPQT